MKKIVMVENQEFNSSVKIGAHHYAEMFAQNGYEVLWISPAYSVFHYFSNKDLFKQRNSLHKEKKMKLRENIYGYAPFCLIPFAKMPILNTKFLGKRYLKTSIPNLKSVLKKIGFDKVDILWISNLKSFYIKDFISYKKLVHRLADEKTGFKGFYDTLSRFEEQLIKESDIVFATSHPLIDKGKKIRDDVIYLPNGVKYDDFAKENCEVPLEFKKLQNFKKCIYVGAIAEWIDKELIEFLLINLPEVEFFFIGPNYGGLNGLEQYKKLHILGKKSYKEIPNYLHFSDVGIIPFKINKLTDAINPVKLYEYLAAGLPTVTTNLKELEYLNGPFNIAYNKKLFLDRLIYEFDKNKNSVELRKYARANDWKERFNVINSYL